MLYIHHKNIIFKIKTIKKGPNDYKSGRYTKVTHTQF